MKGFLVFAVVLMVGCGDDASKKSASNNSVNNTATNNTSTNNTSTNNASNNSTNNTSTNSATNNGSTNNSTNNNESGIPDSMLVKDITDDQETALLDEFDGYLSADDKGAICLVQGYFEASDVIGVGDYKAACETEQARCVTASRDETNGIYRAETCDATVGDLRACEQSKVDQIAEVAPDFVACAALDEFLLDDMYALLEEIPQTSECAAYDTLCP